MLTKQNKNHYEGGKFGVTKLPILQKDIESDTESKLI